jgi:hypothetical protein
MEMNRQNFLNEKNFLTERRSKYGSNYRKNVSG